MVKIKVSVNLIFVFEEASYKLNVCHISTPPGDGSNFLDFDKRCDVLSLKVGKNACVHLIIVTAVALLKEN